MQHLLLQAMPKHGVFINNIQANPLRCVLTKSTDTLQTHLTSTFVVQVSQAEVLSPDMCAHHSCDSAATAEQPEMEANDGEEEEEEMPIQAEVLRALVPAHNSQDSVSTAEQAGALNEEEKEAQEQQDEEEEVLTSCATA